MGVDSAVCRLNHDSWVVFRRVLKSGCGRLPHFPQVTCILFHQGFFIWVWLDFWTFERPDLMRLIKVQIPDVPPFSMQPRFRWSQSERIHFSFADATALFISWRVVLRVLIRDRQEGLEVCAANAVFWRSMRGSRILDASWNHPDSFLPTFPKIEWAVVMITSASLE